MPSQNLQHVRSQELINYEKQEMCNRFSSWSKLLRKVQSLLRWKWNIRTRQAKRMKNSAGKLVTDETGISPLIRELSRADLRVIPWKVFSTNFSPN